MSSYKRALVLAVSLASCGARSELRAPDGSFTTDARTPDVRTPDVVVEDADLAPIAAQLDGLRWELPCVGPVAREVCTCDERREVRSVLRAPAGARYRVSLRVRGVVEARGYPGSTPVRGAVVRGGETPDADLWNVYELAVSDPPQQFFLNAGTSGLYEVRVEDETFSLEVRAGASVVLRSRSFDARQVANYTRLVPAGVPPAPAPFDGQFLQADVVALERLP